MIKVSITYSKTENENIVEKQNVGNIKLEVLVIIELTVDIFL